MSEWKILEIQIDATYGIIENTSFKTPKAVQLLFTVKRISENYFIIFFTPYIGKYLGKLSVIIYIMILF